MPAEFRPCQAAAVGVLAAAGLGGVPGGGAGGAARVWPAVFGAQVVAARGEDTQA